MTRERWEQVLFAHVPDEVVQDMLNAYVLELEAENAKLRELCADLYVEMIEYSDAPHYNASVWTQKLRELGIKVDA